MSIIDLSGPWICSIPGQQGTVFLPGTLDESAFGFPDDPRHQWNAEEVKRLGLWGEGDPIITRLTRKKVYEGLARFSRILQWDRPAAASFWNVKELVICVCLLTGRKQNHCVRSASQPPAFSRSRPWSQAGTNSFFCQTTAIWDGPGTPLSMLPPPRMKLRQTGTACWDTSG